jgi:hypothetical protein
MYNFNLEVHIQQIELIVRKLSNLAASLSQTHQQFKI